MFTYQNCIWQSSVLKNTHVRHGFSTRLGGISTKAHLASMNTGFYRGDSDDTVRENIRILCTLAGAPTDVVGAPQKHSVTVRRVTRENAGEGITKEAPFPCDGFFTTESGITLIVRVADCAPVLMYGELGGGKVAVAAVHAGWRGAAAGIAGVAAEKLKAVGAMNIKAAIGPCIHPCCYAVGEDMKEEVAKLRGADFADRYVSERAGQLYADIAGMNREILLSSGVEETDVCPECTACKPYLYHSHRATGGVRGTMAAVIGIV